MKQNNKILIVGDVRPITDAWLREEISYSRMVEMLNEIVNKKAILREELEDRIASLEFNVNYYLVGLYTDRNFEMAKLNIDKIFFNYKKDVFKKIKENLTNENER